MKYTTSNNIYIFCNFGQLYTYRNSIKLVRTLHYQVCYSITNTKVDKIKHVINNTKFTVMKLTFVAILLYYIFFNKVHNRNIILLYKYQIPKENV